MSSTRIQDQRLTPRKLPKQSRSRESVEAILQAAAQVFERHGYAAGTTNRIAARAGVSIGTLYQYFPNKDAILVALVREHLAEGIAALGPHIQSLQQGARFEDVLPGIVQAMVSLHSTAPTLHRVLFEETQLPRSLRAELETLEDQLVELTSSTFTTDPDLCAGDPRLRARVAVTTIEALTHRLVLRPPQGVSMAELASEITRVVRVSMRP
jgi:AcrR family transcriptional regulator